MGLALEKDALSAQRISFVALTFFFALPLANAVADWFSGNATRAFIARMQHGATRGIVARLYL
jgi:hypothetical protein